MIITDPVPWRDVPVGAQVLDAKGVGSFGNIVVLTEQPRTVLSNVPAALGCRTILLEGCAPLTVGPDSAVRLVIMDVADAVANLQAAGLTVTPITEE